MQVNIANDKTRMLKTDAAGCKGDAQTDNKEEEKGGI